jgi:hypothetical protein
MSDLNILLSGLLAGVAIVGGIAIALGRMEYLQARKRRAVGFYIPKQTASRPFYGDVVTTDPDAGREGRL